MLPTKKYSKTWNIASSPKKPLIVQDVVEAHMFALTKKTAIGEVVNIATETPTTINQLAATLQQIMKTNLKLVYTKPSGEFPRIRI